MFVKNKYIFETRKTRFKRYLLNFLGFLSIFLVLYILFCAFLVFYSINRTQHSQEVLFQRPPDMVVIFTGDIGRIPTGLKLAKEYNQPNIFITGVYNKNTIESLLRPLSDEYIQDPNLLEIDYWARNTVENVISTLRHIRQRNAQEDIIIVSHDYHILRIKLIIDRLKAKDDQSRFFYYGVRANYLEVRNLRILAREVFKLMRAYAFLLLWDPEPAPSPVSLQET